MFLAGSASEQVTPWARQPTDARPEIGMLAAEVGANYLARFTPSSHAVVNRLPSATSNA